MTVEEVSKQLKTDKVKVLDSKNMSEALTNIYDCIFIVQRSSAKNKIALMAFLKNSSIDSIYINEKYCDQKALDDFISEYL